MKALQMGLIKIQPKALIALSLIFAGLLVWIGASSGLIAPRIATPDAGLGAILLGLAVLTGMHPAKE